MQCVHTHYFVPSPAAPPLLPPGQRKQRQQHQQQPVLAAAVRQPAFAAAARRPVGRPQQSLYGEARARRLRLPEAEAREWLLRNIPAAVGFDQAVEFSCPASSDVNRLCCNAGEQCVHRPAPAPPRASRVSRAPSLLGQHPFVVLPYSICMELRPASDPLLRDCAGTFRKGSSQPMWVPYAGAEVYCSMACLHAAHPGMQPLPSRYGIE